MCSEVAVPLRPSTLETETYLSCKAIFNYDFIPTRCPCCILLVGFEEPPVQQAIKQTLSCDRKSHDTAKFKSIHDIIHWPRRENARIIN